MKTIRIAEAETAQVLAVIRRIILWPTAEVGIIRGRNMLNVDIFKEQVGCNVAANEAQIRICNLKLKQNNLPEIPQEYAEVLKMCNGFFNAA